MANWLDRLINLFTRSRKKEAQKAKSLVEVIEAGIPEEVDTARNWVGPQDVASLIVLYWRLESWPKRRALVELLQDQQHPDLPKIMLDFLRAPVVEGDETMELAQAMALGFVDDAYDQFMVYYNDRKLLRQDVQAVLLQHGLLAEMPTQAEKQRAQPPRRSVDPTQPPNQRLMDGAILGDMAAVQQAVTDGANVNVTIRSGDYQGCPALIMALMRENFDIARYLIHCGADIHYCRPSQHTPARTRGQTALWWAANQGNLALVQLLISRGADVNLPDHHGGTPLTQAASSCHIEVVRYLVGHGADIHAKIYDGRKAFNLAVTNGHTRVAEYLLSLYNDPNETGDSGYTPLMVAAENNFFDLAKLLIRSGADVNAVHTGPGIYIGLRGWTPLTFAVHAGLVRMTKLLIESGADVQYKVPAGQNWNGDPLPERSILKFARGRRAERVAALLREAGAR